MRNGQYWCYVIEMADEDGLSAALLLEGDELAAAYRDDSLRVDTGGGLSSRRFGMRSNQSRAGAQRRAEEAEPIAPGFQGFAEYLRSQGQRHEYTLPRVCD